MTLIHDIEKNCPVCGKSSPQPVLTSTNTMGYPDLDLRPAEMQRSTMFVWLDECPHCGYVSPSFSDETDITEDFLKSDEYINCDGFEFKNDLSKRFYKAYLIAKKTKNSEECFFHLLHCAWKCDDAEDPLAAEMRRLALSYFDDLKYSDEKKKEVNDAA